MKYQGGIIASVYHSDYRGGGVSDHLKEITIVGPGIGAIFEPKPDRPAFELVQHVHGCVSLRPVDEPVDAHAMIGPMFGGNFAHTSDSRVSSIVAHLLGHHFYGAIAIHDRYETEEQYRLLSL